MKAQCAVSILFMCIVTTARAKGNDKALTTVSSPSRDYIRTSGVTTSSLTAIRVWNKPVISKFKPPITRNKTTTTTTRSPYMFSTAHSLTTTLDATDTIMRLAYKSLLKKRWVFLMFLLPMASSIAAFFTYPLLYKAFHSLLIMWTRSDAWIPETEAQVALQTNILTQVVNGPIITTVCLLFAVLVYTKISLSYKQYQAIQESILAEIQSLRLLLHIIAASKGTLTSTEYNNLLFLTESHTTYLVDQCCNPERDNGIGRCSGYKLASIEGGYLTKILGWCHQVYGSATDASYPKYHLVEQVNDVTRNMLKYRSQRWVATKSSYPLLTLAASIMGVAIMAVFLIATDEAEFISINMLPIQILWSILSACLTTIGVLSVGLRQVITNACM